MNKLNRLTLIIICMIMATSGCKSQNNGNNQLVNRKPYAAGRFYESDSLALKNDLKDMFLKALPKQSTDNILAIICPHAGYVYSGIVAATSFNQIDASKDYKHIFVIGSSHKVAFEGASVYCSGNFEMPLGTVEVDIPFAQQLIKDNSIFKNYPEAHSEEHCVEVQLPFLQYKMQKKFKIVPIVLGTQSVNTCKEIATALAPYFNNDNLFIISSDFSHYPSYENAKIADMNTANAISSNSPDALIKAIQDNDKKDIPNLATSLCGWTSVLTLLYITEKVKGLSAKLIQYKNSGDAEVADKSQVVGYCSIIFTGNVKAAGDDPQFSLSQKDKKDLMGIARQTIEEYIKKGSVYKIDTAGFSKTIKTPCGAFVTIRENGDLRGCIGRFEPNDPLYLVVQDMAVAASSQDYRFSKVTVNELPKIDLEISVLTPLKKIKSIDEIVLGRDGIYIKKGYSSGTFLPQVAIGTGWTKEEFLGHCAQDKAGIGWDGWKTADLYTYEAIVFTEGEVK